MTSTRNLAGLVLLALSLVLYVVGITTPFMSFTVSFDMGEMQDIPFIGGLLGGMQEKMTKTLTYTIFEAITNLIKNDKVFVAFLIGFFGVFVPLLKTLLTLLMLLLYKRKAGRVLHRIVHLIGRFAMADVFTVGIFIAFLYTQSNEFIKADVKDGYYFFAGYCLLSIVAHALIKLPRPDKGEKTAS